MQAAAPCETERRSAGPPEETTSLWSAGLYRLLVEGIRFGVTVVDASYTVVMVNRGLAAMLSRPRRELVGGKCFREFEKLDAPCPGCPGARAMAEGEMRTAEREVEPHYGGRAWLRVTAFPLQTEGRGTWGFAEVVEDITEQRKTAAELANLARFPAENPHPVLRVAASGELLYANSAAQPLLAGIECSVGSPIPPRFRALAPEALELGKRTTIEFERGGQVWLLEFVPVPEQGYVNVYGQDVTKRTRALDALQASEAKLRTTLADLERFNRLAVGRELRMIGLKREVNQLAAKAGLPPPYDLSFAEPDAERPHHGCR